MSIADCLTRRMMLGQAGRLVMAAPLLTLVGCNDLVANSTRSSFSGATMGTRYRVTVGGSHDQAALQAGVVQILENMNDRLSTYRPDSDLSQLNATPEASWVKVSPELAHVMATALGISRASGGAFDATVAPVVNLWGFGPGEPVVRSPGDKRIAAALARIGHHQLDIKDAPAAIRKARRDVHIDLSGVGKGYAVDRIADYLKRAGVEDFLVDIGGDMRAHRSSPDKAAWRIGIEKPHIGPRTLQRVVNLGSGAIATSGDYRNFYETGGSVYSHIIDPRSGAPVSHNLASVTVVAATAEQADGWSTALMVMGPDAGLELADSMGLSAFFISRTGNGLADRPSREFNRFLVS
ncbi:MAG: FAD:protein FMN transferase [Hyphomicrobiales bacterium]|nr:FAD:protein FMN transferase [Hyphomicrobiales bacterium]